MAVHGVDVDAYRTNRLIRSAVEREFITIGEAVAALRRLAPDMFARITQAQQIVDFRNQLTHGYMTVNDTIVWGVAVRDIPTPLSNLDATIGARRHRMAQLTTDIGATIAQDPCVFRSKSITENAPCRSPRTPHADQAVRSMPITENALMPISFRHPGGIGDRHGRFPAGVT
ncbi:MAG: DUF86 domain-containing protein [Actinomycetota bacterium]|nr:DUF86 domain-containing protein [Actinomycetota bacterium]